MKLLRTTLYLQALVALLTGLLLVALPGLFISILGLASPPERIFMRMEGAQAIVLAMLMVMVAQKADDHWWWAWAFVFGDIAVAGLCLIKAGFSATPGPVWPWWGIGLAHAAFAGVLLYAMAIIGTERQPGQG